MSFVRILNKWVWVWKLKAGWLWQGKGKAGILRVFKSQYYIRCKCTAPQIFFRPAQLAPFLDVVKYQSTLQMLSFEAQIVNVGPAPYEFLPNLWE